MGLFDVSACIQTWIMHHTSRHANSPVSSDGELESEFDETRPITPSDIASAAEVKLRANKAYSSQDFNLSIDLYTDAIRLNPKEATLWSNRAMAKSKLEEHGAAIADASEWALFLYPLDVGRSVSPVSSPGPLDREKAKRLLKDGAHGQPRRSLSILNMAKRSTVEDAATLLSLDPKMPSPISKPPFG